MPSSKTSAVDLREFTLEELAKLPHLVAVHGKVYNLDQFNHPGGDDIRIFGGYDVTVHYEMMHPWHNGKPIPESFEKCCVGTLVKPKVGSPTPFTSPDQIQHGEGFEFDTPFAKDLIATVQAYFKQNNMSYYAPFSFWARLAFYVTGFFASVMWFMVSPSIVPSVIAGLFAAFIGLNVQHDANHGALSKNPFYNQLFGYMADLIGQCRYLWIQQHVLHHHAYTNDHIHDRDTISAEPFLLFNPAKKTKREWYHSYQHVFMFVLLGFYYLLRFDVGKVVQIAKYPDLVPNPWLVASKQKYVVGLYATHMTAFYVIPLLFHWSWTTLLLCHLRDVVTSLTLTMLFMLSHNAMPIKRFPSRPTDWYAMQVETSCTYGGLVAGCLTGGLNFQIEHHLFPRICSGHYPHIAPLVREVCKKHGVSYTYFPTLLENLKSTIEYMRQVGIGKMESGF